MTAKKATGSRNIQKRDNDVRAKARRISPGMARMQLTVEGIPKGKRGYWAGESQIPSLEQAGYVLVKGDQIDKIGAGFRNANIDEGGLVSKVAGRSTGGRLYLMWIDEDLYQKYRAMDEEAIAAVDNQIINPTGGNEEQYIPGGRTPESGTNKLNVKKH